VFWTERSNIIIFESLLNIFEARSLLFFEVAKNSIIPKVKQSFKLSLSKSNDSNDTCFLMFDFPTQLSLLLFCECVFFAEN